MALGPINITVRLDDETQAGLRQLNANMGKLETTTKQTTVAAVEQATGLHKLQSMWSATTFQLQKFARVAVSLQVVMATVMTVLGIKAILDAADAWTLLSARLGLVSGSGAALAATQAQLFRLAQELRAPLDSITTLYTRLAINTENLNLSQSQLISVTRAVSQAMTISGSTAQETSAGVIQLTQALASNRFAGDELKTLLESQPRLLKAFGEGLRGLSPEFKKMVDGGMTVTGALRKMGEQGKLTSDLLIAAILSQMDVLNAEFKRFPVTVEGAWTQVTNTLTRLAGSFDVQPVIRSLQELRQALEDPIVVDQLIAGVNMVMGATGAVITILDTLGRTLANLGDWLNIPFAGLKILGNEIWMTAQLISSALILIVEATARMAGMDMKGAVEAVKRELGNMRQAVADAEERNREYSSSAASSLERQAELWGRMLGLGVREGLDVSNKDIKWAFKQLEADLMKPFTLKAKNQTPEDLKKEVDAAVKLLESKLTLQREMLKLQEASGTIDRNERLILEIGYLERYDEQIGKLLPKLKGMPLEYNQLAMAQLKARQEVIDLTKALHEQENRFVPAVSLTSRLVDQIRNRTTAEEMLAEQVKPLTQADEQHVLVLDDVRAAMGRVGSIAVTLSKEIEAIDARVQKGTATWRDYQKIVDEATKVELDRIDVMEKLHRMSPIDADRQRVAVLEQQRELWVKIREQIDPLDKQALREFDVGLLQIDAKIKDLIDHSLSFGAAVQKAFDGITDILSLFGVKVGKFILMLQNMPKAISGLRGVFAGLGGLMTLTSSGLGLQGTAFAGVGEAVADLGNASGKTAGVLGFLSGTISVVIRTLMLFGNGLTGILGFFGQIVQGIASGGGIINTITSAFSGLVSSGGALYGVFNGLSSVGSALFSVFTEGTSLANIFQGAFDALGLTSGGFGGVAAANGGTIGAVNAAGEFASFLGQWVPVAGALFMAAQAIQNFFSGGAAVKIGTGIGLVLAGPFGGWLGGIIGGFFGPTPKAKLSASIAPFDRNAISSIVDTTVPGTQVGAGIVNIGGNIMKGKKERALQEVLATMINEMLIHVVDATVLMIKTLPPAIGAQLDAALTDLEATGLEIVDKKWKGGKAGKKFNKRVKGLMDETLQDLVTALDFGDVDLKALGFDPNDKKGKKGGEVARGFEAMMMALGGLSAIVKEVGPAVDLSGVSLAQFTKGAIDLFKGFAKEGETFKDTITRIMQTFGEIIAVKDQIHAALATMSSDLTEVVALVTRQLEAIEANMVSMADALTVAIESGGTPEEVLAAAKAATQAVVEGLRIQIDAVTSLHDAVLKLNSAITSGVDLIVDLTQQISTLRNQDLGAEDFQSGLDGIVALFNQLTDVTSRIALFASGLRLMSGNLSMFTEKIPLVVQGFNIIMDQIREMTNPQQAVTALQQLAGAVTTGLQALVASVQQQTQARIAGLEAEKNAIQANFAAQRTALEAQKDSIASNFDAQRTALEAQRDLITESYDAQRDALQTQLDLAQEWSSVLESVEGQLVDLFNLLAPTHPLTSLNEVQAQFNAAFAAFQASPSTEAATQVQDLARQLLQLAQQTPGYDLPSAVFQGLASDVQVALEAIQTFAAAQPSQEVIQAQMAALEVEQAASLAAIETQLQDLQALESGQLSAIDAQIAALNAGESAALANIDQRIASANADGLRQIQEFQELAAQGLDAIRNQLIIEVTALAAQQAIAAAALHEVLGDKSFEQFIAEKQAEAADLLRGIDQTLQHYLGSIITGLGFGVPAMASGGYVPASPGGTLVRLGEGGRGEWVVPEHSRETTRKIVFAPQITITGQTADARKLADELESALVEKMRTGSRLRRAVLDMQEGRG